MHAPAAIANNFEPVLGALINKRNVTEIERFRRSSLSITMIS